MNQSQYKILFASSEVYPFVKTGGLADVSQALPEALQAQGHELRIVLPAYRNLKSLIKESNYKVSYSFLEGKIDIHETTLPKSKVVVWLINCPALFDRAGGPYSDEDDQPWDDNIKRFALFSRAIAAIAIDQLGLKWQPDILHCNDWQTALAPALLQSEKSSPGIVFTIHNLAYQGIFPMPQALELQLSTELYSHESMEFYGQFSFLKGGVLYADHVTTVSPTYSEEIQTEKYGAGLHDFLSYQSEKLSGIINGISYEEWNPSTDTFIFENYNSNSIERKQDNKKQLQTDFKLPITNKAPLFACVSRLVSQKGIDLILKALPLLIKKGAQIVVLGKGDDKIETELAILAEANPGNIYIKLGYDEALAHKITAAADFFLMPSRFEPCGLNQMYSQAYGTIPIVRKTGGLTDTVLDNIQNAENSTGICFQQENAKDLLNAIERALAIYMDKKLFNQIRLNGMQQNYSWKSSAKQYLNIYRNLILASD